MTVPARKIAVALEICWTRTVIMAELAVKIKALAPVLCLRVDNSHPHFFTLSSFFQDSIIGNIQNSI